MKFKIKNNEPEIEFWLEIDKQGWLCLKAKKNDFIAPILWIESNGKLRKNYNSISHFGFDLDSRDNDRHLRDN